MNDEFLDYSIEIKTEYNPLEDDSFQYPEDRPWGVDEFSIRFPGFGRDVCEILGHLNGGSKLNKKLIKKIRKDENKFLKNFYKRLVDNKYEMYDEDYVINIETLF